MATWTTPQAVLAIANSKTPFKSLIESAVGILIAKPGHRSSVGLSAELLAGRTYLLICRLQDTASAPMHARMGMISVITVRPSGVAPASMARLDTIVGIDYAFKAPRTLSPGRHTLTFVNGGKVVHEANVALLRRGVTPEQAFKVSKDNGNISGLVEEWLGVMFAKAGEPALGRLEVNLLPNRDYMIKCDLADADSAPAHVALGMFSHVRTRKRARVRQ
jgi:hypothetical protein